MRAPTYAHVEDMSDDEEDYMSDAFLASLAQAPGPTTQLHKYSSTHRKKHVEKKAALAAEKSRTKPLAVR